MFFFPGIPIVSGFRCGLSASRTQLLAQSELTGGKTAASKVALKSGSFGSFESADLAQFNLFVSFGLAKLNSDLRANSKVEPEI